MIGIITPLYNDEKRIAIAIDSVLNQERNDCVHFICDDCSTDNSRNIVEEYSNKYPNKIVLLSTPKNSGPSTARNIAINAAIKNADYIAFLDSDDIWDNTHLSELMPYFIDYDFVFSKAIFLYENKNEQFQFNIAVYDILNFNNLLKGNSIYISSVIVKSEIIKDVGNFDSYTNSLEDWDYWLRVAKKGYKMIEHKDVTITYLVKNDGMAGKSNNIKYIINSKYNITTKLNLGCGDELMDDYINCDLYGDKSDMLFDAMYIPFPDNSIDEIRAYHLIEHFDFMKGNVVLKEWFRVLKPNGKLVLETPDLLNTCKIFVNANEQDRIVLYGHFFAWPWIEGQVHYFLFTETQMKWALTNVGFNKINREKPDSMYAKANPQWESAYLKVIAYK